MTEPPAGAFSDGPAGQSPHVWAAADQPADQPAEVLHSQVVRTRGLQVSMRVQGSGEPLLLLNGLTRPLDTWAPFVRALGGSATPGGSMAGRTPVVAAMNARTIISFDAPGIGDSSTPVFPVSMPGLADVAARVLDAAGFETADIVGFSHGGAVAQQLALDAPSRVRSLVLAATSCGLGAVPGQPRDAYRGLSSLADPTPWPQPGPLGVLWQILAISSWSSYPALSTIHVPTLVVCGAYDRTVAPANSELLASRIPGARLERLQAGHDLQRGTPALAFAALVDEFLDGLYAAA